MKAVQKKRLIKDLSEDAREKYKTHSYSGLHEYLSKKILKNLEKKVTKRRFPAIDLEVLDYVASSRLQDFYWTQSRVSQGITRILRMKKVTKEELLENTCTLTTFILNTKNFSPQGKENIILYMLMNVVDNLYTTVDFAPTLKEKLNIFFKENKKFFEEEMQWYYIKSKKHYPPLESLLNLFLIDNEEFDFFKITEFKEKSKKLSFKYNFEFKHLISIIDNIDNQIKVIKYFMDTNQSAEFYRLISNDIASLQYEASRMTTSSNDFRNKILTLFLTIIQEKKIPYEDFIYFLRYFSNREITYIIPHVVFLRNTRFVKKLIDIRGGHFLKVFPKEWITQKYADYAQIKTPTAAIYLPENRIDLNILRKNMLFHKTNKALKAKYISLMKAKK